MTPSPSFIALTRVPDAPVRYRETAREIAVRLRGGVQAEPIVRRA